MDRLGIGFVILLGWAVLFVALSDYRDLQRLQESGAFTGRVMTKAEKATIIALREHSLFAAYMDLAVIRLADATDNSLKEKRSINQRLLRTWPGADVAYRQAMIEELSNRSDQACAALRLARAAYPSSNPIAVSVTPSLLRCGDLTATKR
jgi:hypothetical protein